MVERRFERLARNFDGSLEGAVSRITDLSTKLLDEKDGALPRVFGELETNIEEILGETFDEDSKSSAIAKISTVMDEAVKGLDRRVRAAFDPDAPDSSLAKTKREIIDLVKEQVRELRKELQEVAIAVAAAKARARPLS